MTYSPEQFVPAAQKYLDEKVAKIDRKYHAVDGLPIHLCQTGELYAVIECDRPWACKSADLLDMTFEWYCAVDKHAGRMSWRAEKMGAKLYWHTRPTINCDYEEKAFRLYSRLRITNKPEVWPTLEFYEASKPVATDPDLDDYRFGSRAA